MNSLIEQGVLTEKMNLLLGPLEDGSFHPVQVQSIQRHKSSCRVVRAGQSASLALNIEIPNIRKGMILAAPDLKPQATLYFQVIIQPPAEFHPISRACSAGMRTRFRRIWLNWIWFDLIWQATIVVLSHSTCIHTGFQTTVHIGSIQQTAVLEGIMSTKEIGTNDTASVLFRFLQHPEFIRTGSRLFFRTGITQASQGIGRVTQVFPVETGCHANWTSAADRNSEAKKKKKINRKILIRIVVTFPVRILFYWFFLFLKNDMSPPPIFLRMCRKPDRFIFKIFFHTSEFREWNFEFFTNSLCRFVF